MLLDHIAVLDRRITKLDRKIRDRARTDDTARRLMSIPGVGPISAVALEALEVARHNRVIGPWSASRRL